MTAVPYDLHVHTDYSDGSDMREMARAAADAGLEGVGFADHCIPFRDDHGRRERYDLVETYDRRRADIEALRETAAIEIFDAVEVTYHPDREAEIRTLLEDLPVDYAIGSVHFAGGYDFTSGVDFADADAAERRGAVERYFDWQVALVESGLFDVVGHLDLPQRVPALRGVAERRDYERVAAALADAEAVPEVNAGRADRDYGTVHPRPDRFEVFRERGVGFTVGTDAHRPAEVGERLEHLRGIGFTPDVYPV